MNNIFIDDKINNKFSDLKEKIQDFLEKNLDKLGKYTLVDGFIRQRFYNEESKLAELPSVLIVNESTGEIHSYSIGVIFPDWKEWWGK